jgi:hypothetical protein
LLSELQAAHQQLQDYAGQGRIDHHAERNRQHVVTRTVSQMVSAFPPTRSAQLLLEKDADSFNSSSDCRRSPRSPQPATLSPTPPCRSDTPRTRTLWLRHKSPYSRSLIADLGLGMYSHLL